MTDPFPAAEDSPADARTRLFSEVYFGRGWSRTLTASAIGILGPLVERGAVSRAELDVELGADTDDRSTPVGLAASAFDPLTEWTEDELAAHRDELDDSPFGGDDDTRTAAEVTAEDAAERAQHLQKLDRYSAALGVAPVRTLGELLDLMAACRLLTLDNEGRYALNPAAPLPAEVLPLDDEEAALQDRLR